MGFLPYKAHGLLAPPTRDQMQTPCTGGKILTTGPVGKSRKLYKFVCRGIRVKLTMHIFLYLHRDTQEEEETLPNSFHEVSITLIPKPNEDYKSMSPMNMDIQILNKRPVSWIQQHIKMIIHHDQVGFTSGKQSSFNIWKSTNAVYHINKW